MKTVVYSFYGLSYCLSQSEKYEQHQQDWFALSHDTSLQVIGSMVCEKYLIRSCLKKVFSPDIGVVPSSQVLDILQYVPQGYFLRGAYADCTHRWGLDQMGSPALREYSATPYLERKP